MPSILSVNKNLSFGIYFPEGEILNVCIKSEAQKTRDNGLASVPCACGGACCLHYKQ